MKKNILVTGYVNPDLDAYACAAGYAELLQLQGRDAQGSCFGQPLSEVGYVMSLLDEPALDSPDPHDFQEFVIVDTSEARHIPAGVDPGKVAEVIDHHLYNDPADFPNANLDLHAVGAAATLVAERFKKADQTPRRAIAALLYAAIISNTLDFKAAVTTDRDVAAAGWLAPLADLPLDFSYSLFQAKSEVDGHKLHQLMNLEMNPCEVGGKWFNIGSLEMVGVPQLLADRNEEITTILQQAHVDKHADVTLFSMCDVELGKTYFITPFTDIQAVIREVLNVKFSGTTAEYPAIILRKEYVGPLRERILEQWADQDRKSVKAENAIKNQSRQTVGAHSMQG